MDNRGQFRAVLAAFAVALAAYLLAAPHVAGDKDASEFTLVLATGGAAHPTGYPLYTLFGHAFVRLVHGLGAGWDWAANAWSALWGAAAMAGFARLLVQLGRRRRAVLGWGLVVWLLFAWNPVWTAQTTLAEVYSAHVAWALWTMSVGVSLLRAGSPVSRRTVLWSGALCGVGLGHHGTALFVIVPVAIALAWRRERRAGRLAFAGVTAGVAMCAYGWIAWRAFHPGGSMWPSLEASWAGVWEHITGAQYRAYWGRFAPSAVQRQQLLHHVAPFVVPGVAALGWNAWAPGPDRRIWRVAAVVVGLSLVHALSYAIPDPAAYFLVPMAFGLIAVPVALERMTGPARVGVAVAVGVALATLLVAWTRVARDRNRALRVFDARVAGMWSAIPAGRGFVLWSDDMVWRLRGYQMLRGEKTELVVLNPLELGAPVVQARFRASQGFDAIAGAPGPVPSGGSAVDRDTFSDAVAHNINRQSPWPVVIFDPQRSSVRVLKKVGTAP